MSDNFRLLNDSILLVTEAPGGIYNGTQLSLIADVSKQIGSTIKITEEQRICLVVQKDKLGLIEDKLLVEGISVRPYKSSPSQPVSCLGGVCQLSKQDALDANLKISELLVHADMQSSLKIGINGCSKTCVPAHTFDISIIGEKEGYKIYIGGKNEVLPELASFLAEGIPSNELPSLILKTFQIFENLRNDNETLGELIERRGMSDFVNEYGKYALDAPNISDECIDRGEVIDLDPKRDANPVVLPGDRGGSDTEDFSDLNIDDIDNTSLEELTDLEVEDLDIPELEDNDDHDLGALQMSEVEGLGELGTVAVEDSNDDDLDLGHDGVGDYEEDLPQKMLEEMDELAVSEESEDIIESDVNFEEGLDRSITMNNDYHQEIDDNYISERPNESSGSVELESQSLVNNEVDDDTLIVDADEELSESFEKEFVKEMASQGNIDKNYSLEENERVKTIQFLDGQNSEMKNLDHEKDRLSSKSVSDANQNKPELWSIGSVDLIDNALKLGFENGVDIRITTDVLSSDCKTLMLAGKELVISQGLGFFRIRFDGVMISIPRANVA